MKTPANKAPPLAVNQPIRPRGRASELRLDRARVCGAVVVTVRVAVPLVVPLIVTGVVDPKEQVISTLGGGRR